MFLSTAVGCGSQPNPNRQVRQAAGTTFGQTATYSCNIGYNVVGYSTRTCQATEVWSGSEPMCQRMYMCGYALLTKHLVHLPLGNLLYA